MILELSRQEQLNIFKSLFKGRDDCYGAENTNVKEQLTDSVITSHLLGQRRIGVYMMLTDSIFFACVDIDRDSIEEVEEILNISRSYGLSGYIECSKRKGFHIWYFFSELVKASKIRAILKQIHSDSGISEPIEIFPKQDYINNGEYGNFINLPLFKTDLENGRTAFLDPLSWKPYLDQWYFLNTITTITPQEIDDTIEINNISIISEPVQKTNTPKITSIEGDINKVINECLFIQHCINKADNLSEPLWYAMICNLVALPGGHKKIHKFSEPYKNYTYDETQAKIEHAIKDAPGPTTCQQIKELGYTCAKVCNVKAPAGLAYKASNNQEIEKSNNAQIEPSAIVNQKSEDKPVKGFNLTDYGNAERLVFYFGDSLHYCYQYQKWNVWDSKRWKQNMDGEIYRLAKDTVRNIYAEASKCEDDKQRKAIVDHARRSEYHNRILAMISLAQSERSIAIESQQLDANLWTLNCLNGTIDLKTVELLPHNKNDLITKLVPVEYDPNAKLEMWDNFLDTATNKDTELQSYLQRAVGYSLTGDISEEKLFFISGPAGSGKSTFVEAIKSVLGDYAKTADFETFISRNTTGNARNDVAALAGARFVSSIEVDKGKRLAEGLVKLITGGDTVTARFLYQESFSFMPQFKLWLVANDKPKIDPEDDGLWRRIVPINFDHVIPEEERDPVVKTTLKNPEIAGPAILAWAVKGCLMWQKEGLHITNSIKISREQYMDEMNVVSQYVDEYCEIDPASVVSKQMLYSQYRQWCKNNGINSLSKINFGRKLKIAFPELKEDAIGHKRESMVWGKNRNSIVAHRRRGF